MKTRILRQTTLCLAACLAALSAAANYYDATNAAFANIQPTADPFDDYYGWTSWVGVDTPAIQDTEDVGTTRAAHFKFTGLIPEFPHAVYAYGMYVRDLNYSYAGLSQANSDLSVVWTNGAGGTPFAYLSWHELADVTADSSGEVNLFLGNSPTPAASAGGVARFDLVPIHTNWSAVFQVEDVIVNPGVLGTYPDNANNRYEIGSNTWGGATWLALHDSETVAEADVPHLQLTGLQPNHWYAMQFRGAWLGDARYSLTSATDANNDLKVVRRVESGAFDTLNPMASAQADPSGIIDIYLGDYVSRVPDNFAGYDYIEVWDATASILQVTTVEIGDVTALSFASETGQTYRLEYATHPTTPKWSDAGYTILGTGQDMPAFDPNGVATSKIYRIRRD